MTKRRKERMERGEGEGLKVVRGGGEESGKRQRETDKEKGKESGETDR